jgi:serine/threonine-protein kinase
MGSVWRSEHLTLGSDVAVKLIDPAIAGNEQARERFVREARAAAKLRSPHVVQILDYGVDGEVPFIVMEMLRGESLADRLERVGRIPPEDVARIMSEVARALTRAHEAGIIHRDLKPDNIFLNENDDTEVAKVLDFGVARIEQFSADNAGMTSTGAVLGTPYYMSPEQAEGSKSMDHRTDIWALAVMTYECIVGVRPFQGETLGGLFISICSRDIPVPSTVGEVPTGFDAWFQKGTARVLADRFRTAREAAAALRDACHVTIDERETALPTGPVASDKTMLASDRPPSTADASSSASIAAEVPQASVVSESGAVEPPMVEGVSGQTAGMSTPGLAHTAMELPTKKGAPTALWIGAAIVAAGLVGFMAFSGRSKPLEEEGETAALVAEEKATTPEPEVSQAKEPDILKPSVEPDDPKVGEKPARTPTSAAVAPAPRPSPAPAPKPQAAPSPAPAPKPQVAPSPAPAPRPQPKPASAPRPAPHPQPKPAPPPAPKRVNLGI